MAMAISGLQRSGLQRSGVQRSGAGVWRSGAIARAAGRRAGMAAGLGVICALAPVAAGLCAEPGEAPRQNKAPSTTVSGVTVTLSRVIPRVVSTYPAQGATVAPGVLVLRVSFDQAMFGQSWSYVTSPAGAYPDCAAAPRRLDDRKSFALICRTTGKTAYALWFNRTPYANFLNLGRRAATPFLLKFSTSDAEPVWTLQEAMKSDPGLPPGSNPAEAEGKRRPGEDVDIDAASTPQASTPQAPATPAPNTPKPAAKPS